MTGALRQHRILRALFSVAVALVLMTRLLAPSGFMPVMTKDGVMVTLCTGQGAVKMLVDRDSAPQSRLAGSHSPGDDRDHEGGGSANDHCAFAGAASLPTLPTPDSLAILPVWHWPTGPIALALRTGWIARLAAPPPPSSGPPLPLD